MSVSESQILCFISQSTTRISFSSLKRHLCIDDRIDARTLKHMVAGLVRSGELQYTSHFGNSYLEVSYNRPRAVSEHVVLKPPMTSYAATGGRCVVTLERGAAFGVGEHPTTQLAIQLLDGILHAPPWKEKLTTLKAIDIGTGSGILAIVAAKMGLGRIDAIDTDPCAVFEARHNVCLNRLQDRVRISDGDLGSVGNGYDLVLANLRTPTLLDLRLALENKLARHSLLIFSGIKVDEITSVGKHYEKAGFSVVKKGVEKGWSAICFTRGSFQGLSREDGL